MIKAQALRIRVRGVVQGVGFRPFIYRMARENGLNGRVYNTSGDVTILVEGQPDALERFLTSLRNSPPPQAHIESVCVTEEPVAGYTAFQISDSRILSNSYQLVSPDLAVCPECRKEVLDPAGRRFRYAFTNCTNCGPRFTIIQDIPYDRPRTTMRSFQMCPECRAEYNDPSDRRFHAQPIACPACGPRLELADAAGNILLTEDVLSRAAQLLQEGQILAVKGLGGFLLACDATSEEAVSRLRTRKRRPAKPLAIMVKDISEACRYVQISQKEEEALTSPAAPIVLLKRKEGTAIAPGVAPGLKYLGVMLPATPLQLLLSDEAGLPLVMTSGNLSEEPIAKDNEEALARLSGIADFFILHNRDIFSRYDDSVVFVEQGQSRMVRRARGYAPFPVHLPFSSRPVLACGADLKNTFCLTRDDHAFISQFTGDMESEETLNLYDHTVKLYENLFRIQPEIMACDMHPDYISTRWAENSARENGLPLFPIQHHHAHIAGCMADNGIREPVIGVAMDGSGWGPDGRIWGGEWMIADYAGFQRKAHLEYLPLPGGSLAIKKPYRTAAGYLYALLGQPAFKLDLPCFRNIDMVELEVIKQQVEQGINTPLTSSCGRLFDAVSSLLGIRQQIEYEGQAAIELEMAAAENLFEESYPYRLDASGEIILVRLGDLFPAIISDLHRGVERAVIAARFHNTLAALIRAVCRQLSRDSGMKLVALSGGVFQNRRLLNQVVDGLKEDGLTPLLHTGVPCNDGGISLGQAAIAASRTNAETCRT